MDFHGGSVVKNLPANAGDTGLIPDPGRFHMLRRKLPRYSKPNFLISMKCYLTGLVANHFANAKPSPQSFRNFSF